MPINTIAFRVDATAQMGIGHMMRCLTLADHLSTKGAQCLFVCRQIPDHLHALLMLKGHSLTVLDHTQENAIAGSWLSTSQQRDAQDTLRAWQGQRWDWLVVDHYGLDHQWHRALRPHVGKILVIDDLADRRHDCDLLLDQTLHRDACDYQQWVPRPAKLLVGAAYALLRPEFIERRAESLEYRQQARFSHLLISLGGTDPDNLSLRFLKAIAQNPDFESIKVTVVLSSAAPALADIEKFVRERTRAIKLQIDVDDMAGLLADVDFCIGAAGTSSWERCCLGVPTLIVVVAENQLSIAGALVDVGAATALTTAADNFSASAFIKQLTELKNSPARLQTMSKKAATLVDGSGVTRLLSEMMKIS